MPQFALIEPLFQEKGKSTSGRFFLLALCACLGSALLLTQIGSVGFKFIPTRPSPLNLAWISTKSIAAGTERGYYGNGVVGGPAIPQQGLDQAMSYYGSQRYGHYPSRYQDHHYQNYHYQDDYARSRTSLRFQDYNYRPRGYGYGDEVTFGSRGEPHLAAYRFRPGESEIFPMSRYGGGEYNRYRGGYNDRYGGGYYDRYRGGSYDRYGYYGRSGGHRQHQYR